MCRKKNSIDPCKIQYTFSWTKLKKTGFCDFRGFSVMWGFFPFAVLGTGFTESLWIFDTDLNFWRSNGTKKSDQKIFKPDDSVEKPESPLTFFSNTLTILSLYVSLYCCEKRPSFLRSPWGRHFVHRWRSGWGRGWESAGRWFKSNRFTFVFVFFLYELSKRLLKEISFQVTNANGCMFVCLSPILPPFLLILDSWKIDDSKRVVRFWIDPRHKKLWVVF